MGRRCPAPCVSSKTSGATVLVSIEADHLTPLGMLSSDDDAFTRAPQPLKALLDGSLRFAPGDRIRLGVDLGRLHLFDADTGAALRS